MLNSETFGSDITPVSAVPVEKWTMSPSLSVSTGPDAVIVEEPLEIRLKGQADAAAVAISVTMRTPGDDLALALGFLFGEGVLDGLGDVEEPMSPYRQGNHWVEVWLRGKDAMPSVYERHFYTTSSCGVCGKASVAAVLESLSAAGRPRHLGETDAVVHQSEIASWVHMLESNLSVFPQTGGNHGSCILDRDGQLLCVAEDVGRHNAFDKCVGKMVLDDALFERAFCACFSGRISFELMQKVARAGIPMVVGLGAPSSLAISLAQTLGIALVGFAQTQRFNLYHRGRLNFVS